jgi:hypothetical protein
MHAAADHLFGDAQLPAWGTPATGVLVETLLDRGAGRRRPEPADGIEQRRPATRLQRKLRHIVDRGRGVDDLVDGVELRQRHLALAGQLALLIDQFAPAVLGGQFRGLRRAGSVQQRSDQCLVFVDNFERRTSRPATLGVSIWLRRSCANRASNRRRHATASCLISPPATEDLSAFDDGYGPSADAGLALAAAGTGDLGNDGNIASATNSGDASTANAYAGVGGTDNDGNEATAANTGADSSILAQAGVGGIGNTGNSATATNSGSGDYPNTFGPTATANAGVGGDYNTGNTATATNDGANGNAVAEAGAGFGADKNEDNTATATNSGINGQAEAFAGSGFQSDGNIGNTATATNTVDGSTTTASASGIGQSDTQPQP